MIQLVIYVECEVKTPFGFTFVATHLSTSALWLGFVMAAMYCMMYLLASVFPAPLSPETRSTQRFYNKHKQIIIAPYHNIYSLYSFYFLNKDCKVVRVPDYN